jgi:ABC-type glutathione transport system ATPase component
MNFEAGQPDRKTVARPESRTPPRPGVAPPSATQQGALVNGIPQAAVAGEIPVATVAVVPAAKPTPPPPPMIELINFGKRYGDFTAVEQLNLRIPKGELYGFIGPNGAGKSTTIRFLATLLKASHGEGIVNGHSWRV